MAKVARAEIDAALAQAVEAADARIERGVEVDARTLGDHGDALTASRGGPCHGEVIVDDGRDLFR